MGMRVRRGMVMADELCVSQWERHCARHSTFTSYTPQNLTRRVKSDLSIQQLSYKSRGSVAC